MASISEDHSALMNGRGLQTGDQSVAIKQLQFVYSSYYNLTKFVMNLMMKL